jgi:RNA polymerase sigma-70 factor (ECF subfamily)
VAEELIGIDLTDPSDDAPATEKRSHGAENLSIADEERLVSALQAGREAAYEELIAKFQQPVYNLVYRLLNDAVEAGDVLQEVFLKIFRSIGAFRGQSSLKTWIYRIAINEAYNQRRWFARHRQKEVGLERDDATWSIEDSVADRARSPYDLALDHETRALIEEALADLNPVYRAAVALRDIEDLSYEEIAEILQVSLGTVKSRILRGREALRQRLLGRLEPATGLQFAPQTAEWK